MGSVVGTEVMGVGAMLLRERRERELAQPQMAELLGVSLRQYQRWEHGISAPRQRQLARIRTVLAEHRAGEAHDVAVLRGEVAALRAELQATRAELDALAVQFR